MVIYKANRVAELNQKTTPFSLSITSHTQGAPSTHCLKTFPKINSVYKKKLMLKKRKS
jgi:hypothetical protein